MTLFNDKAISIEALNWSDHDIVSFLESVWKPTQAFLDEQFKKRMNLCVQKIFDNPVTKNEGKPNTCSTTRHQAFNGFHQLYWEMHCVLFCLELDLPIVPYCDRSSGGPDILIRTKNEKTWIECVAPTRGIGQNAVPALGEENTVPIDLIAQRYTAGLAEKNRKLTEDYLPKKIVDEHDVYVIAINGVNTWEGNPDFPNMAPAILKCLYGMGRLVVPFSDSSTGKPFYEIQKTITGSNGQQISNSFFTLDTFKNVSGVLFSRANPANRTEHLLDTVYAIPNINTQNSCSSLSSQNLSWYEVELFDENSGQFKFHPRKA